MERPTSPVHWRLDELGREIAEVLATGAGDGTVIDGRALAVKASPLRANATRLVMGTAALPPGYRTPPHAHEAEEVAIFLSGRGRVEIDGASYAVDAGSVLLTPPWAEHTTCSDDERAPLVVLWFYAPPGSEARWLEPPPAR